MKNLRFDPRAQEDLDEAIEYYGGARASAAVGFGEAIEHVLELLRRHPQAGTATRRGARKWPLSKYPYLIVYRVTGDDLIVLSVTHMRRRPIVLAKTPLTPAAGNPAGEAAIPQVKRRSRMVFNSEMEAIEPWTPEPPTAR